MGAARQPLAGALTMAFHLAALRRWLALAALVAAAASCTAAEPLTTAAGTQVQPEQQAEAQAFWTSFRDAAQKEDWPALARLCAQPLLVRGAMDDDPVKRISGAKLPAVLRQQMAQPLFVGKGKPMRTLAAWVRETPVLAAEHWLAVDQIRFHNLVFRKGREGWKLTTLYDEEA